MKICFGRSAFAKRLAEVCVSVSRSSTTSAVALVGPWGSGKSSVLNMSTEHFREIAPDWQIVRFNPWLYSDINSLVLNFFGALAAAIPADKGRDARQRLGRYLENASPLGALTSIVGIDLREAIGQLGARLQDDGGPEEQRERLEQSLRSLGIKILIVIDDIDRLQPTELLLLFKLVRMAGRLPNVYYLLAYDEATGSGNARNGRIRAWG
jgi:predicted KAP-like P-loop ATPase